MFTPTIEEGIKDIIRRMMNGVLQKRLVDEPWNLEQETTSKPFHFSLAPEMVWKGSKFERSLVTTMGQIGWEQIARLVAQDYHGYAENGRTIRGKILQNRLNQIHTIIDQLEHGNRVNRRRPDWDVELREVLSIDDGESVEVTVTMDLYVENAETNEYFYCEIKSPKPNSDQTKVSKEKMLKIKAMYPEENHHVFYALPFNPFGQRENYSHAHPKRWFDMINDEVVLMGKEFWDILGGEGAYEELIEIFEEVGQEYRPRINRDYFGLTE